MSKSDYKPMMITYLHTGILDYYQVTTVGLLNKDNTAIISIDGSLVLVSPVSAVPLESGSDLIVRWGAEVDKILKKENTEWIEEEIDKTHSIYASRRESLLKQENTLKNLVRMAIKEGYIKEGYINEY